MEFTPSQGLVHLFNLALYGSGPVLVVAAIAGLIVAILLGAMQVNDQTLPQVVKTTATALVLLLFGAQLFGPLLRLTQQLFEAIPMMAH